MGNEQASLFGAGKGRAKAAKPKPQPSTRPTTAPAAKLTPRQQQQRDANLASVRKEREQARVGDVRLSDFFLCELHGEPLHERLAEIRSDGGQDWVKVKLTCAKCLQF